MEALTSGTLTEGNTTFSIGKIASIIINIWVVIILMLTLIASGVLTTITASLMTGTEQPELETPYYLFISSSVIAWISFAALLIVIGTALILTEGAIILFAPFTIIILAIVVAILCIVIAVLNLVALGMSYGSLPFDEGQYAGIGAALAAMAAIIAIGYFILTLALKRPKPQTMETVVIV